MTHYLRHADTGMATLLFGLLWIAIYICAMVLVIFGSICIKHEKYDTCFGTKNSAIVMTSVGSTFLSINFLVTIITSIFICYQNQRAKTEQNDLKDDLKVGEPEENSILNA